MPHALSSMHFDSFLIKIQLPKCAWHSCLPIIMKKNAQEDGWRPHKPLSKLTVKYKRSDINVEWIYGCLGP